MRAQRAIRTVHLYAALGAFASVLSAWGCHLLADRARQSVPASPWMDTSDATTKIDPALWVRYRSSSAWPYGDAGAPGRPMRAHRRHGVLGDHEFYVTTSEHARHGQSDMFMEFVSIDRVGLPVRSMRVGCFFAAQSGTTRPTQEYKTTPLSWHGGALVRGTGGPMFAGMDRLALPIEPLWPGFAINTALFGAFAFVLVRGLRAMRRAVRRRRQRCPACGYDRAGLDAVTPCPECGRAVATT